MQQKPMETSNDSSTDEKGNTVKKMFAIALVLGAIFFVNPSPAQAATFDIIGVGDSVGKQVFPGVGLNRVRWLNGEPSRAPFVAGVPPSLSCGWNTCGNSTLTGSIISVLTSAVKNSEPGGYVIVQDAGHGDKNGKNVTLTEWRNFVAQVLALIPDDRTLVFIYPAYDPVVSQTGQDVMYQRTIAARDLIWVSDQPFITVNWWYAVETHDQNSATPYMSPDGLHPSAAGIKWLQDQLNAAIS
jgi:hypothetical protein